MQTRVWLILVVCLLAGCGRNPQPAAPTPTPLAKSSAAEKALADLLKAHGEKNIVSDPEGIGVGGNPTRIHASLYSSKQEHGNFVVETEFRTRLSSGEEIVDYIAGVGETEAKAVDDTVMNFALTAFHPLYRMFINTADPHQKVEPITLADGQTHSIAMGDIYLRGGKQANFPDLNRLRPGIKSAIAGLRLLPGPHWIKIVYGQMKSKPMTVAVTLDNGENAELTSAVKALDWPVREDVYIAKEFIILK